LSVAEEVEAGRPRPTRIARRPRPDSTPPARDVPSGRPGSAAAESARPGVELGERSPYLPFPPSQAAVPDRAVKCHVAMVPNSGWGSIGVQAFHQP